MDQEKAGVILKPGKEKAIKNRHHWIFSGAIQMLPEFTDGDILPVSSASDELLGYAYFNRKSQITGRMLSFGTEAPLDAVNRSLHTASRLRQILFHGNETTCYRLINGEGDGIPGLVVDVYNDILVLQISTLGMHRLRDFIVEVLTGLIKPACIYEKSNLPSRRLEGLPNAEGPLSGELPTEVLVRESGLSFFIDIAGGQKTGFFLDQRENRRLVQSFSRGRKVLNCFSYTGGFSVYAAAGGAASVTSMDTSESALKLAKKNCAYNFSSGTFEFHASDVFRYLREQELNYDLVILDPPAFAKKRNDVVKACRGYKDINRLAIAKMPPESYLLTCSCSYYIDESLFQQVLFEAAREANRNVRILQKHHQAVDHPVNIYHPEGEYLKSFFCYVE